MRYGTGHDRPSGGRRAVGRHRHRAIRRRPPPPSSRRGGARTPPVAGTNRHRWENPMTTKRGTLAHDAVRAMLAEHPALTLGARALYLMLANMAGADGVSWHRRETLAAGFGSTRTFQ